MRNYHRYIWLSPIVLASCHRASVQPAPPPTPVRPPIQLSLSPEDMSSAVDVKRLRLTVDNYGEVVPDELLAKLAQGLSLLNWPGLGSSTSLRTTVHNVSGNDYGPNGYRKMEAAHIDIEVAAPLPAQWHVLRLNEVPAGTAWNQSQAVAQLAKGAVGVRFTPASEPRVRAVRLCHKGEDDAVVVDFSEDVTDTQSDAMVQQDSGRACERVLSGGVAARSHPFVCRGGAFKSGKLKLLVEGRGRAAASSKLVEARAMEGITRSHFSRNLGDCMQMALE